MDNLKKTFYDSLDNGTVPENVLTVGRLIQHLMDFPINIPVKIFDGKIEKEILYDGCSPSDSGAYFDDDFENPKGSSWFEIQID